MRVKKKLIVVGNRKAITCNSPNGLLAKYFKYSKNLDGYYSDRKIEEIIGEEDRKEKVITHFSKRVFS